MAFNRCFVFCFGLSIYSLPYSHGESLSEYMNERKSILDTEKSFMTGGDLFLTNKEVKVNDILMKFKQDEIYNSYGKNDFPPSKHFFYSRPDIENSKVFNILRKMPKGAALHLHDSSMVNVSWLIKNVTYMANCYACVQDGQLLFKFSSGIPDGRCNWELTSTLRNKYGVSVFDTWLYNNMTLFNKEYLSYSSQRAVWERFHSLFDAIGGLTFYAPVFKAYFLEALMEFYEDNVQYIEFRGLLTRVYDMQGKTYNREWMVETYRNLTQQFMAQHRDFSGSKFIYSSSRGQAASRIQTAIQDSISLNQKYPDYFIGYDLVGQEDPGHSLKYFINDLLPVGSNHSLKYFFHAGETDWEGEAVDENVIDALLLNTSRIGHGFSLLKHPAAIKMGREKKVAVEVCPISNQVLKLVDDLRNHPAAVLLTTNYPVVISADDPGLWGAQGLSYDFYEAFMGLGGAKADLAFLKQLAINSLQYSAMSDIEKKTAFDLWTKKWDIFLNDILAGA